MTFREIEKFKIKIVDLKFEEVFNPIEKWDADTTSKVRVFLTIVGLKKWAAGKAMRFIPGIEGVRPSIWYVREGFNKYLPCSTNKEMDEFTRSLIKKYHD